MYCIDMELHPADGPAAFDMHTYGIRGLGVRTDYMGL